MTQNTAIIKSMVEELEGVFERIGELEHLIDHCEKLARGKQVEGDGPSKEDSRFRRKRYARLYSVRNKKDIVEILQGLHGRIHDAANSVKILKELLNACLINNKQS